MCARDVINTRNISKSAVGNPTSRVTVSTPGEAPRVADTGVSIHSCLFLSR